MNSLRQEVGAVGSVLAGACCVGFAPVLAGVSAIGAGFLLNGILFPFLALFLGVMLWGLTASRRRHGQSRPLYLSVAGSIAAFAGPWIFIPVAYGGFATIIAAVAWDWVLVRNTDRSCESTSDATSSQP